MNRILASLICFVAAALPTLADDTNASKSEPKPLQVEGIRNVHVSGNVMLAGQPTEQAFAQLAKDGYTVVVSLRHLAEERFDEEAVCKKLGMTFVRCPINAPSEMNDELISKVCKLLDGAKPDAKVLCHCAGANRVGAVWIPFRVEYCDLSVESAQKEAEKVGLKTKELEQQALSYLQQKKNR